MKLALISALAGMLPLVCLAGDHGDGSRWPVRDQETIHKTLPLDQAPMRVVIDNVEGYVHVTGVSGTEVRVTAHKRIQAETDADLEQARKEIKLDVTATPGGVSVYYDAPWRCDNSEGSGCHNHQERFYSVVYDIDVEVPAAARLVVSAVNQGDVRVDGVSGDYQIKDINGGIRMAGVSGSGLVHTINGPVTVHYAKNPRGACSFKSINGSLDVWFQPDLSADLLFKTFNGQVYSDFDVAPRAVSAAAITEKRDGKFIYHSNRASGGRTGNGGSELSFDSFNGSIRIHREQ